MMSFAPVTSLPTGPIFRVATAHGVSPLEHARLLLGLQSAPTISKELSISQSANGEESR